MGIYVLKIVVWGRETSETNQKDVIFSWSVWCTNVSRVSSLITNKFFCGDLFPLPLQTISVQLGELRSPSTVREYGIARTKRRTKRSLGTCPMRSQYESSRKLKIQGLMEKYVRSEWAPQAFNDAVRLQLWILIGGRESGQLNATGSVVARNYRIQATSKRQNPGPGIPREKG